MNAEVKPDPTPQTHHRPGGWRRLDVLVASIGLNLLALALPLVILQVYDRILPNHATETFGILLIGLVVVLVLEFLLRGLRSALMAWEAARYDHQESLRAMEHLLAADTQQFEDRPAGYFLDRIQALDRIQEFYSGQAMLLVIDFPFVLTFLAMVWVIAGELVLVPLSLLAVFLGVSWYAGNRLHTAVQGRSLMEERRHNFLIEVLQGIHSIKSMSMEPFMLRRYERLQGESASAVCRLASINSLVEGVGASFAQLSVICFVGLGAGYVISGDLSVGALAAGTMLSGRALQPGIRAMGVWSQFQAVRLATRQVDELFDVSREQGGTRPIDAPVKGELELRDLHFSYMNGAVPVLSGVSLKVRPGEAVAITGRNGAGKTTLIRILSGFIRPSQGEVLLDGRPLADYRLSDLRAEISLLPQHGLLFEGTILENMTLFREGEAVDQAIELVRLLELDQYIARLPQGLETQVSGSGQNALPEGVAQKVIMVRAMIGHPHLMLFDDANANLDLINDQQLLEVITRLKGSRTMIIVTHRPSYMRLCDRQLELVDGQLQHLPPRPPAPAPPAGGQA